MPNISSFGTQTDNAVVQGTVTDRQMVIPEVPPQGLMSVGPRQTYNFIKEPWNERTSYVFYDAVKDGKGSTYIATKPVVPAGTPLTDEDYWFKASDPNAQFNELQNVVKIYSDRISANENNITNLTDRINISDTKIESNKTATEKNASEIKKINSTISSKDIYLCLGDSWMSGGEVARIIATQRNLELVNKAISGGSFGEYPGFVKTVRTQCTEAASEISDAGRVKLITIVAGVNDVTHINTTMQPALNTIVGQTLKLIRTTFPNAEIIFAPNAPFSMDHQSLGYYYYAISQFQRVAYFQSVTFMNLFDVFNNKSAYKDDGLHPNDFGYGLIASILNGGLNLAIKIVKETSGTDQILLYFERELVYAICTFKAGSKRSMQFSRNFGMKQIIASDPSVTLSATEQSPYNLYKDTVNIPQSSSEINCFFIGSIFDTSF